MNKEEALKVLNKCVDIKSLYNDFSTFQKEGRNFSEEAIQLLNDKIIELSSFKEECVDEFNATIHYLLTFAIDFEALDIIRINEYARSLVIKSEYSLTPHTINLLIQNMKTISDRKLYTTEITQKYLRDILKLENVALAHGFLEVSGQSDNGNFEKLILTCKTTTEIKVKYLCNYILKQKKYDLAQELFGSCQSFFAFVESHLKEVFEEEPIVKSTSRQVFVEYGWFSYLKDSITPEETLFNKIDEKYKNEDHNYPHQYQMNNHHIN